MLIRLQAVKRAEGNSFDLPIAQADLADVLGISAVHVNRMLQELRGAELVKFFSKHIEILDIERLRAFAQFTPGYLRLDERIEARHG
ncbi:MAG: winged helix-turn-helix domain-containing protein [Rhodospirillales bacterium]|nr:winged helix-turn-helix domain-containing protein [Acetobacter sp.]